VSNKGYQLVVVVVAVAVVLVSNIAAAGQPDSRIPSRGGPSLL
jgi:hypothetical protein